MVNIAAGLLLLAGCGVRGSDPLGPPAASTSTEPALLSDLQIEVVGDSTTELCFAAESRSLAVTFNRRCYLPPHELPIMFVAGQLLSLDDPAMNSASLLVTPLPLTITGVSQPGVDVVWRQIGQGAVVLGLSFLAVTTKVTFSLEGISGTCSFAPDKESCNIG